VGSTRVALAHESDGHLRHRCEIAASTHRTFLTHHRSDALVEHIDLRLNNLQPYTGVTPTVSVETGKHSSTGILFAARLATARRMGIEQILLVPLSLLRRQPHLSELSDPGVDAVHHLTGIDLALEQRPAFQQASDGVGVECYLLPVSGYSYNVFDGEGMAV
jgi:hypothetical protein